MTDAPAPTHQMHATGRDRLFGHLAMLLFAALIAGSFSLGKLAVPYIDPLPLNALRFILGALVMGGVAFGLRGQPLRLPKALWRFGILGALLGVYFVTMFIALTMTAPVSTSAVFTLMPIMTAFFAYLILKQIVRPIVALSLLLAGLGSIWVIFNGNFAAIRAFEVGEGELIFFGGCVCYAIYAPLLRKFNYGEPLSVLTFFTLLATAIWICGVGLPQIIATDWLALPPIVWWTLAYLAIFPTAASFFLVQYASMRLPSSKTLAYGYLTPICVILIEGFTGHGWVTLSVALGALVTCLGLVVLYFVPDN